MTLETIDIINGILLLFIITISIIVGLKIISLYFKNMEKVYIFAGLTWIFLVCPWYPHSTAFITILTTGQRLTPEVYFILGNIFIPIAIILWLYAFTELCYKKKQKIIIGVYFVYAIVVYILFFYFLLTDPNIIGELQGDIEVQYSRLVVIYYITILVTILITGVIFGIESMKSENPEVKLRGKLIIIAFFSYVIGIMIDAILDHTILSLLLA